MSGFIQSKLNNCSSKKKQRKLRESFLGSNSNGDNNTGLSSSKPPENSSVIYSSINREEICMKRKAPSETRNNKGTHTLTPQMRDKKTEKRSEVTAVTRSEKKRPSEGDPIIESVYSALLAARCLISTSTRHHGLVERGYFSV
jgi:hypothetical protein